MPSALRRSGKCAICAFRTSDWLPLALPYSATRLFSHTSKPQRQPSSKWKAVEHKGGSSKPHAPRDRSNLFRRGPALDAARNEFATAVLRAYGKFRKDSLDENKTYASWGIKTRAEFTAKLVDFRLILLDSCDRAIEKDESCRETNPIFHRLFKAYMESGLALLGPELKYVFIHWVVSMDPNVHKAENAPMQEKLADLRFPIEWYPATRAIQRKVHLHVGPTNSGKTYHALQRLEQAQSGIYAGPLRLLAHEVYTRMNAKGKKCALITGEERRIPEGMRHPMSSCTVEMVPLNSRVDVAVIDEIQMMGNLERGWAWTQAFLGVQATEVHLCGELRTIELITDLCRLMGDELIIHKYERLSPLRGEGRSLGGDLGKLQKGDAIILFSRVAIHAMKSDVEKKTGKRAAIVYGSLPPETRAQQAALFNDPDNDYDYLVASDAVGMGLNLSIKRIIFEATSKHDGIGFKMIETSDLKQIAGRAGRYKTAHNAIKQDSAGELDLKETQAPNVGLVTTLENFDLPIIHRALRTEVEPIKAAGIFPPNDILLRFADYFPRQTPFSYILLRLHAISTLDSRFFLCKLKEQIQVADLIQPYKLSNIDRVTFISAPVALREPNFHAVVKEMASCVADKNGGELMDLKTLYFEILDMEIDQHPYGQKGYLRDAEVLHKGLTLYLWLSYRFAGVFRSQALAFHVKGLVEDKINLCLSAVHWDSDRRQQLNVLRRRAIQEEEERQKKMDEYIAGKDSEKAETSLHLRETDESDAEETFEDGAAAIGDDEELDADTEESTEDEAAIINDDGHLQTLKNGTAATGDDRHQQVNIPAAPVAESTNRANGAWDQ